MDSKEANWLLQEKYGLADALNRPEVWPQEATEDMKRLSRGEPLAYVIGFVPFLDCHIDLRFRPLIPRAETEYWAGLMAHRQRFKEKPVKCLDLFAGSGCLGLALLKHWSGSQVDFADKSKDCLKQVKINLALNQFDPSRSQLIFSDTFSHVRGRYDVITANPPYIAPEFFHDLPDSVKRYEPKEALLADNQGLFLIESFLVSVAGHLEPEGEFWLEFDSRQKNEIEKLIDKEIFEYQFGRDQYGFWRFLFGRRQL